MGKRKAPKRRLDDDELTSSAHLGVQWVDKIHVEAAARGPGGDRLLARAGAVVTAVAVAPGVFVAVLLVTQAIWPEAVVCASACLLLAAILWVTGRPADRSGGRHL